MLKQVHGGGPNRSSKKSPKLDLKRNPEVRKAFLAEMAEFPDHYPRLGPGIGKRSKPLTYYYNCVAATLCWNDEDVWPGWRVQDFDQLYAERGYEPADNLDWRPEAGVEKIVLYGLTPKDSYHQSAVEEANQYAWAEIDRSMVCTHVIKLQPDGSFLCKHGHRETTRILDPRKIAGGKYGWPIRVYRR